MVGILDLKTTGLITKVSIPHIVEVSIKILETPSSYTSYVYPGDNIFILPEATRINNITNEDIRLAPPFHVVAQCIVKIVKNSVTPQDTLLLLGHNMHQFDQRILEHYFETHKIPIPSNWVFVDTLPLFKQLMPKPHSLKSLHERLCKDVPFTGQHKAKGDVLALERCLKALFPKGNLVDNIIKAMYK